MKCMVSSTLLSCLAAQYDYNPWQADWSKEMRGLPVISAPPLTNWLMFYTRRNANDAQNLLQSLNRVSGPLGIRSQKPVM